MGDKISVIIPVYNVDKYLEKCVLSVINQTLKDIELIIVNDGSTDNSYEIINKMACIDTRIKVINQKNKGVSGARNLGLKVARGEYISFIDSDDWIREDMLEKLYSISKEYNSDVIGCNFTSFTDNTEKYNQYPLTEGILMDKKMIKENVFPQILNGKLRTYVWDKIYKRKFLNENKIEFDEKIIIFEDWHFIVEVFEKMNSFYYLNENLYKYRIVDNTLSRRYYDNFFEIIISLQKRKLEFMKNNNLNSKENIENSKYNYLDDVIKSINHIIVEGKSISTKKKIEKIKQITNNEFTKQIIDLDIKEYTKYSNINQYYIRILINLLNRESSILMFLFFSSYQTLKQIK